MNLIRTIIIFFRMKFKIPKIEYKCLKYALIWVFGNAVYGIAPLLFLMAINPGLQNQKDHDILTAEITKLLEGGIILFVCCALMGAVIIEILIEKIYFKRIAFFALNIFPFVILITICFLYLLMLFGHVRATIFSTISRFYLFVVVFTFIYCILGKYFLYVNNEKRRKSIIDETN